MEENQALVRVGLGPSLRAVHTSYTLLGISVQIRHWQEMKRTPLGVWVR